MSIISADMGVTTAQLTLAWTAGNPRVSSVITRASSVITRASRPEQVIENMKVFELVSKIDDGARKEIEGLFDSE